MDEQTPNIPTTPEGADAEAIETVSEAAAEAADELAPVPEAEQVVEADSESAETASDAAVEVADEFAPETAVEDAPEGEEDAEEDAEAEEKAPVPHEPPDEELLCGLQCILFVAGEPLQVDRLAQALGKETTDIHRLCDQLNDRLVGQGLHVVQLAGGFALATRPEYADYVQRLLEPEPERLSIQALETLAIVAYRQPITRPEIDQLRGVNSGGVVASLLEKGLLRIRGRKDAPGRPFMLETTAHFLSAFGLGDLTDLPKVDLPEIGQSPAETRVLSEALEELATIAPEDEPSDV
jgi:segregation and condensation protein B